MSVETLGNTTTVITEATVDELTITVENNVVITGEDLNKPTFTLNSNGKAKITLSNDSTTKAVINAEAARNNITFSGNSAKSPKINGDAGKELIKIKEGTELTGKSTMKLGANKDSVVIDGIINKLTIDNGDDNAKDKVNISNLENIQRKLKINNFGEEDRLIIEGDAFKYQILEDSEIQSALKELGIIVNLTDNS